MKAFPFAASKHSASGRPLVGIILLALRKWCFFRHAATPAHIFKYLQENEREKISWAWAAKATTKEAPTTESYISTTENEEKNQEIWLTGVMHEYTSNKNLNVTKTKAPMSHKPLSFKSIINCKLIYVAFFYYYTIFFKTRYTIFFKYSIPCFRSRFWQSS